MSYSIYVEDLTSKFIDKGWENKTFEVIEEDPDLLISIYEDFYGEIEIPDSDSYNYDELIEEKVNFIKDSRGYYEIMDGLLPIYNFVHILQNNVDISDNDIKKIYENTSNTVIIEDNEGNNYIGLTSCGMDLSQNIAYAYMVIDHNIPESFKYCTDDLTYNTLASKEAFNELKEFIEKQHFKKNELPKIKSKSKEEDLER